MTEAYVLIDILIERIFLPIVHEPKKVRPMTATATLSSKFQISIPKTIRETQHWEAGQKFTFIPKGDGVLLQPVPDLNALRGIAAGKNPEGYRDRTDRY